MKERPILFSAPMVRALLAGSKTQTRRVCKAAKLHDDGEEYRDDDGWPLFDASVDGCGDVRIGSSYGVPGDRLWVRETWAVSHALDHLKPREVPHGSGLVYYAATENLGGLLKRPSIFMPRWTSRITLEVTGVRVERLQAISEADAIAEGIEPIGCNWRDYLDAGNDFTSARRSYRSLWESINGAGSWDANPWVWVVEFKRVEA